MAEDTFDTRFALPAIDHPALTEIGVILSGLAADRLLAGLGVSGDADDPALVTLMVDRLRHGDRQEMAAAGVRGAHRWRAARSALVAVDRAPSVSASIRQAWQRALRTVRAADLAAEAGPAEFAYLAACWLRCTEIDAVTGRLSTRTTAAAGESS